MNDFRTKFKKTLAKIALASIAFSQLLVVAPQTTRAAGPTLVAGDIVVNEVYANPTSGDTEKVELLNVSAKTFDTADLSALIIKDSANNTFGNMSTALTALGGTWAPNVYVVLTSSSAVLNNTGDSVNLNNGVTTLESFTYAFTNVGKSWAKIPNGSVLATDWQSNREPTFGVANRNQPGEPNLNLVPGTTHVYATWGLVTDAVSYEIDITPNPAGLTLPVILGDTATLYTFSGLTVGTSYTVGLVAKNEVGSSNRVTKETTTLNLGGGDLLDPQASATYSMNSVSATKFGVGDVAVSLSSIDNLINGEVPQTISFTRPNSAVVTQSLTCNLAVTSCATSTPFSVVKSNGTQDGTVTVAVTTSTGRTVSLIGGTSSFTVDTQVNAPVVTVASRCSTLEDSFMATTDSDVVSIWVYRDAALTSLIATTPVSGGVMAETFIGDNMFGSLYLVAKDLIGNLSSSTLLSNDITAPSVPGLNLESGNGSITASWSSVTGATQYRLKWRESGTADWSQKVTSATKETFTVKNNVAYDVTVTSLDAACNESALAFKMATARPTVASVVAAVSMSDYETRVLDEAIQVESVKDGDGSGNGSNSGGQLTPSNGDGSNNADGDGANGDDEKNANVKDRSNLIVTIAILLIIAGIAIAAYSWYQGEESGTSTAKAADDKKADTKTKEEPKAAESTKRSNDNSKNKKGGSGKNRKTRW